MKKLALTLFLFSSVLLSYDSLAQKKSGYDKGTVLLNGGIGVGRTWNNGIGNISAPSLIGNVEWSVHEYVGIGPYIGFLGLSNGSELAIGARGTFHYAQFIPSLNTREVDLYGTLHLGANIKHINNYYSNGRDYSDSYFVGGPVAGARYFFGGGGFGAFGEVGWGPLGVLTIGLSGKF